MSRAWAWGSARTALFHRLLLVGFSKNVVQGRMAQLAQPVPVIADRQLGAEACLLVFVSPA